MGKMKNTVLSNLFWRFAERIGAQGVSFVVSIVLARLLAPDVYGTVALITVFITILQVFVDSGLGNALIQKKDCDNIDFSTVFYTNIFFCIILYIFLYLTSPWIATFYHDMSLVPYIRVLGITLLISGVKNVQQAYVSKYMMFKKFFFSTVGGTIAAGIVGILMALNNYGVWALIAQQLINLTIDTVILWFTVNWRPQLSFSFGRLKKIFSFGWKLLASSLINSIYDNIRQLIIGKIYSSADLAQYNRGKHIPNIIVQNVNTSIDSVLFPVLSREQDSIDRVKEMTRKSVKVSTYVMAPMMVGLAVIGKPLILLLLTEKWLPALFYMRIFCVCYIFYPIHTANLNAIKAMGRSDIFLKLEIWKKIVGFAALLSTAWISVEAMAYSLLITQFASQVINSWPNKKLLNYGYLEQIKDLVPSLLLAGVMGAMVYPLQNMTIHPIVTIFIQVTLGGLIYIFGSCIFKLDSFQYILTIVKSLFKRKVVK